jgi:hypothetical protein
MPHAKLTIEKGIGITTGQFKKLWGNITYEYSSGLSAQLKYKK